MKILHTEASEGFGGQEVRILRESEGMRARGHDVFFAVVNKGALATKARHAGFTVYELPFEKKRYAIKTLRILWKIIHRHHIELINTHSSWDAWIGGILARWTDRHVVRTRHLSTPTRAGINSRLLFCKLADAVVTTCEESAESIRQKTGLLPERCRSIPTGVDPKTLQVHQDEIRAFRKDHGFHETDVVAGTLCVLRHWKGVLDLISAAKLLQTTPQLKWLVVGDGPSRSYFEQHCQRLGIQDKVIFTGYLNDPRIAIASMDLFLLLSTAHEGVSQACTQAAYLKKPLITTPIGGLSEICREGDTGFLVPPAAPEAVALRVAQLAHDQDLRERMGNRAQHNVLENFTLKHTLDGMEAIYKLVTLANE